MKSKAEILAAEVEARIETAFRPKHQEKGDFWATDAKRVYSALHELMSYAAELESKQKKS